MAVGFHKYIMGLREMMGGLIGPAPGRPGLEPRWTSSAKSGVGTAVDSGSRVWFTISHGIVNEVY
jgi:glucoamylase